MPACRFVQVFLGALLLTGCVGPRHPWPALSDEAIAVERGLIAERRFARQMEDAERLHRVSWPLLRAIAEDLPEVRQRQAIGIRWMHAADVPNNLASGGLSTEGLTIVSVAPQSPADLADLAVGDVVLEINGERVPTGAGAALPGGRLMASALGEGARASVVFLRDGSRMQVDLVGVAIADFNVGQRNDHRVNARALPRRIQLNEGMLRFVRNEEELAFVVAHELAHSVMRHHRAIAWNAIVGTLADVGVIAAGGLSPGFGGVVGGLKRLPEFEREADLLALRWMQLAGFEVREALDFWPRLAARSDRERRENLWLPTHPPVAERQALMRHIAEAGATLLD
ncbi:MAG: M48 family metalloprotease [Opitutales bacterium]|nr:M48 family metalloprotease [Opitutales bacterium]